MASNALEFWESEGPVEVAERTYFASAFSNVTAFETDEGLVLIDSGVAEFAPVLAKMVRERTDMPVHTVVYTHGHVDHTAGVEEFLAEGQDKPRVVAHENVEDRFERYAKTRGHNNVINARQFGGTPSTDGIESGEGLESDEGRFGEPEYAPDTLYRDSTVLTVGDLTFELHHGKGETDDHTWVYCRERDVLCTGDFFVSVAPNAGNPQKVQRYPEEWSEALREMAGKGANSMCPGHGEAVVDDKDGIETRLLTTADYLDDIVEQTLDALNDGSPPHVDIVHEVETDYDEPWLEQVYDEDEFIVRNLIRRYGGWWSGRPSELKPASRESVASEIAELADGAEQLADRARELREEDEHSLACHLADYALEAEPENEDVREAVNEVYTRRADDEQSLMSSNIFMSAAAYADEGRPFR
jgi:glyoxylase-like metal-dependent hydrolase (beta-lactamase superfamily II)